MLHSTRRHGAKKIEVSVIFCHNVNKIFKKQGLEENLWVNFKPH